MDYFNNFMDESATYEMELQFEINGSIVNDKLM